MVTTAGHPEVGSGILRSAGTGWRVPLIAAGVAAVCFVPWFAWLTMRGELPGNTDTWLAIALAEDTWSRFTAWIQGLPVPPSSMFPVERVLDYGEPGLFWQLVYGGLRIWTDDLVILWNAAGCGMALANVAAVAFLASILGLGTAGAVASGLLFGIWGFWFANIDDITYHFYAVTAVALATSRIAVGRRNVRLLVVSGVLLGLNAWMSVYVFVLSILAWLCVLGVDVHGRRLTVRQAMLAGVCAVLPASPIAIEMVRRYLTLEVVNPFNPSDFDVFLIAAKNTSIHLQDFLRPVRGTLLIPDPVGSDQTVVWSHLRRAAWPGFAFALFWFVGAVQAVRGRRHFPARPVLVIWAIYMLIAIGPVLELPGFEVPMPLFALYSFVEPARFFRVPLRALTAAHLAASLVAGAGVQKAWNALSAYGRSWAGSVAVAVVLLQFLEHVPLPPVGYAARTYLTPPEALVHCAEQLPPDAVVAFLPSSMDLVFYRDGEDLYPYNREMIYLLWQIRLGRASVNGANGYIPPSRVEVDRLLRALPESRALARLTDFGVTHLVLVDPFAVHPRERAQVERIRNTFADLPGCGSASVTVYPLETGRGSGRVH